MKKTIKNTILIFLILTTTLLFTGCWNYREINEVAIVIGAAIDKDRETGKYILTVEIINPQGRADTKMVSDIVSMEGNTVFEAVRSTIMKIGKRLYWSHAKVFIISQGIAREGIVEVLDFINRDSEVRSDVAIVISKEENARQILQGQDKIHSATGLHIKDALTSQKSIPRFSNIELWEFLKELAEEGISPIAPTAYMVQKKDELTPQLIGTAIFKKDKMVGTLDELDTQSLLFIREKITGGIIITTGVGEEDTDVALEILNSKANVKTLFKNDMPYMKIDLEINGGIAEITGTENFIDKKGRAKLKEAFERNIKEQLQSTIKKVQVEFNSDVFGFGSTIQRQMPDLWKKIKPQWNEMFSSLETEVNVKVTITGSALTSEPIKIGE